MILAFIHQKGGTGKSTLSISTAIWLAKRGRSVVILDVDTQGSSFSWGNRYGADYGVKVIAQHARLLSKDIREIREQYEDVILDLPPTVTPQTERTIEVADLLIIPMRPTHADLWALDRLVALILVSDRKPPPPYKVVFTQCGTEDALKMAPKLVNRRVEAVEVVVPAAAEWQKLFEGAGLSDEMDRCIGSILMAFPRENLPIPM